MSGVGSCIPRHGMIVPFLVLVEYEEFGLGDTPCTMRFWMFFSGLPSPLLWQQHKNWFLRYIVDVVYDDGLYLAIIFVNLPFYLTLSYDLDHPPINLHHLIIYGFGHSN